MTPGSPVNTRRTIVRTPRTAATTRLTSINIVTFSREDVAATVGMPDASVGIRDAVMGTPVTTLVDHPHENGAWGEGEGFQRMPQAEIRDLQPEYSAKRLP